MALNVDEGDVKKY